MDTIQISHVHFEADAAFCFAKRSPKPPLAGATGAVATGAATTGGAVSFFSAGLAPNPVKDGALDVFASFEGIPKVNFGAEFDSFLDSLDDTFGAFGFGASQQCFSPEQNLASQEARWTRLC